MAFFPADHAVPETLRTPTFVLRPLRVAEAGRDYAAYMSSPEVIRVHSGGHWPVAGFTLADEERELAHHEARHRAKQDFAFILLTPDGTTGLGCVYLLPLLPVLHRGAAPPALLAEVRDATAIVTFWVRQDRQQTPLASQVILAVHHWLLRDWPFADHLFRVNPGEHASIAALDHCGFRLRFALTLPESPYLFFGTPVNDAAG